MLDAVIVSFEFRLARITVDPMKLAQLNTQTHTHAVNNKFCYSQCNKHLLFVWFARKIVENWCIIFARVQLYMRLADFSTIRAEPLEQIETKRRFWISMFLLLLLQWHHIMCHWILCYCLLLPLHIVWRTHPHRHTGASGEKKIISFYCFE